MRCYIATMLCLSGLAVSAQMFPVKIEMPPVHSDPNIRFNVLHYDVPAKDRFTILCYQIANGSVLKNGEFVQDTGGVVYKDEARREPIYNSNAVILLRKQTVDGSGKQVSLQDWTLAERKLEGGGPYKLYFRKKQENPLIANRVEITRSVYNAQELQGLSDAEMTALLVFCQGFLEPEPTQPSKSQPGRPDDGTIAEDLLAVKKQFKSLRESGLTGKGDLPGDEKRLTQLAIEPDRVFTVTRGKGTDTYLKFYLTEDYKNYSVLDSVRINGDVTLTSAAVVYNLEAQPTGAFVNLHYKTKNDAAEDISRQLSIAMDSSYAVATWIHSTGKDKLNSLAPEICWYEGRRLRVMSNNREKFFKSYVQVHEFMQKQDAKLLYPATEEEKASEKTGFVKTYQPPPPMNTSQIAPVPERYVPIRIVRSGDIKYFVAQGEKYNSEKKAMEYLSLNIYRIEKGGKLTSISILGDYRSTQPFPIEHIVINGSGEYFLLSYPTKVHLIFTPEKAELVQLTDERTMLLQKKDGFFVQHNTEGAVLLKQTTVGNKYTMLYYPAR